MERGLFYAYFFFLQLKYIFYIVLTFFCKYVYSMYEVFINI